MTREALKDETKILSDVYTDDANCENLFSEICHLKQIHKANIHPKGEVVKPVTLLNRFSTLKLKELFPNVCVALRIFLTLPVTVETAERSFSKLSLVKNKPRKRVKLLEKFVKRGGL